MHGVSKYLYLATTAINHNLLKIVAPRYTLSCIIILEDNLVFHKE